MEALGIVDRMVDPAFAVDRKQRLVALNKGAEELLGCEARSILGKPCYQVIRGTDVFGNRFCASNCPVFGMARCHGSTEPFDLNLPSANSENARINVSVMILARAASDFAILHCLKRLGLRTEPLSRLVTANHGPGKSQNPTEKVIRGLTHEIRNSLQMIIGEIENLNLLESAASEYHVILDRVGEIDRLLREADEYLAPDILPFSAVDPLAVLKDLKLEVAKVLADHGIRIAVVCKVALPKITVDPHKFYNAVRRIIDFSPVLLPHGGEVTLDAKQKTVAGSEFLELSVGMTSETPLACNESDVFQPFVRVNNQRVGLNMALAQEILRRLHGNIIFRKESQHRGIFSILIEV